MRTKRLVGVAIVTVGFALTLGGCRYYWFKPGSTAEMFGRDSEACLQDARSASPATQKYGVVNEQVYRACLTSKGYERQKTTEGPDKHRGYEFDD
jgi:hypothetical protein